MSPVGVGLIGSGRISGQYLQQLASFPDVTVHIVGDLVTELAAAQAAAFGVAAAGSPQQVLDHPGVEIVVNLTSPAAHAEVSLAALRAGKHVWTEKPFALTLDEGRQLLAAAAEGGLRIGGAPDTLLGAGLQTARRIVERGDIGVPLSGLVLFETPGPPEELFNMEMLLSRGAGPLWDMGPYYLSALAQALGSFRSVYGLGRTARPTRLLRVGPNAGRTFDVQVPTHVSVLADFAAGPTATAVLSWDSPHRRVGHVEIVGTEATLSVPDPNRFDGAVRIRRAADAEWTELPVTGPVAGRGLGVLDIARAVRTGAPQRIPGELGYHILETTVAITESIETGVPVEVRSAAPKTESVPEDWDPYAATL